MRVTIFVDYSDPLGGLLSWASDISAQAEDFKLTLVGVVTDESRSAWAKIADADAPAPIIPVHRDEIEAAARARSVADLAEKLRAVIAGPSVYIPNAYETGYRLALTARRLGVPSPIVTFSHTDEPHYYYLAQRYEPCVSTFIVAERRSYAGLLARIPHRRDHIIIASHGLKAPAEVERLPHQELRLLYVGRVVQLQKRVFDLIEVAQALRALGVKFRLDIIGDGGERAEFERAAAALAPEISCLGCLRRQEVLLRYRDYDCFILCSSFEGMSIALMEAMAYGVVPVVTRVGGAADLITDGVEGFMWPVGETSVAAARLNELWQNPQLMRSCSRAAQQRILTAHDPARSREQLLSALRAAFVNPVGSAADAERLLQSDERSSYFRES